MRPRKYTKVYQFKIELWVKPLVWRRIQVPANYTFWDLHCAIQDAMGWEDCHIHEFTFDFDPATKKETRIGDPYHDEMMGTDPCLSEFKEKLNRWFTPQRKRISYNYDFGDQWWHTIILEGVLPAAEEVRYPICTGGQRACPPEDCGGQDGYAILYRKAKRNPEKYGFFPGNFDPTRVVFENPRSRKKRLTSEVCVGDAVEIPAMVTRNPDPYVLPFTDELVVGPFVEQNGLDGKVIPHLRHTGFSLRFATNKAEMNAPVLAYDYGGGSLYYLYVPSIEVPFKPSWDNAPYPDVNAAGFVRLVRVLDDIYEFGRAPRDITCVLNELNPLLSEHGGGCAPLHSGCFNFIRPDLAEMGFAIARMKKTKTKGNYVSVVWVFETKRNKGKRISEFLNVNSFTFIPRKDGGFGPAQWNRPGYLLSKPLFNKLQAIVKDDPIAVLSTAGRARATDSRAPSSS
jgi:hypothetical protein